MELIDDLIVPRVRSERGPANVQLLVGDLSALPPEHAVDVLVVSAFPNDYSPVPGTVFASLRNRGLDVRQLAETKEEDERDHLGCWLSRPIPPQLARDLHFTRLLCFEPQDPEFLANTRTDQDNIDATVGFVFRCLNNFVIPDERQDRNFRITSVAMPLLATGNQRVPLARMLPALLDAAAFWLGAGLPIETLKIVVFRPNDVPAARKIFAEAKATLGRERSFQLRDEGSSAGSRSWEGLLAEKISREIIDACRRRVRDELTQAAQDHEQPLLDAIFKRVATQRPTSTPPGDAEADHYDVFVSYAHAHDTEVAEFITALQARTPPLRIFYDRTVIPPGGQWIKMVSDAVQRATAFVAVLSPAYSASPVCWDEFQCAKLKEYNTRQAVIKTVRLFKEPQIPPIMGIYSYVDCVEGDRQKLRAAAATIV